MNHPNVSQSSLDDNMYDISMSRNSVKKPYKMVVAPRRVGSMTSLSSINEGGKRPGDYFVAKLNNCNTNISSPSSGKPYGAAGAAGATGAGAGLGTNTSVIRPKLGESILSVQSDDTANSQFENPDSRLSSLSSTSVISPSESPSINHFTFSTNDLDEVVETEEEGQDDQISVDLVEMMNTSLSTITLRNQSNPTFYGNPRPQLRSASSSNVINSTASIASSPGPSPTLFRTKTKYLSAKQRAERQQLRKKMYDENDCDDDLLHNDLDLVFNVPVIRNHSEIFVSKRSSKSGSKLNLHSDLQDDSNYYPQKKPFSLPGIVNSDDEDSSNDTTTESFSDSQVTQDISKYYSQRSTSILKQVKMSREQELLYKLPNYVKSQSSIDDLTLMSSEKLNHLDQSRPINLPPKSVTDISKHTKEFKKNLSDFELNSQNLAMSRQKQSISILKHHKEWDELKEFSKRKLNREKSSIRTLIWSSNCPSEINYEIWKKFLTIESDSINDKETTSFDDLMDKLSKLSSAILANKDSEFYSTIEAILKKPIYNSILLAHEDIDIKKLKNDFKTLLYLQTMSTDGLRKHDEAFLIPSLLLIFKEHSLREIFDILSLLNKKVFTNVLLQELNSSLNKWGIVGGLQRFKNYSELITSKNSRN